MKNAYKNQKSNTPNAKPSPRAPAKSSAKFWLILALCLLVPAGATWAVMEFIVWNTLPPELVGKWVVQGGEQEGATFDFYRNSTLIARVNNRGNEDVVKADIAIENKTMFMTTYHPQTKEPLTKKLTIITVTGNRLVIRDEQENVYRMERATP